ncbi:MAG: hypothetical protein ACXABY_09800 [Candidatus Thorarchaeota archaeon]|jgi:hypothetical protein
MTQFERTPVVRERIEHYIPLVDAVEDLGGAICGGFARYCASPCEEPAPTADIDIYYFTVKEGVALGKVLRELGYKEGKAKSVVRPFYWGEEDDEDFNLPIHLIPANSLQPVDGRKPASKEEVLTSYDFTVVQAALDGPYSAIVSKEFMDHEKRKVLYFNTIDIVRKARQRPNATAVRIYKYVDRGYAIGDPQLVNNLVSFGQSVNDVNGAAFKTWNNILHGVYEVEYETLPDQKKVEVDANSYFQWGKKTKKRSPRRRP